ncbi:MAG: thermonuclease family protein [Deltaproteobacteria bacterium]|nr:thermonuclease family protein [Deltaproteobacteria bacterium]
MRARLVVLAVVGAMLAGCGPSKQARRYSRETAQKALTRLESPGLLIGEFPLAGKAVVDGDTVKVQGLDTSLRLLAIDTEETFKREKNRRASEANFTQYLKDLRGTRKRPIKTGTPMGEEAKKWAKQFFAGSDTVRLERDHPKDIRGRFGRYLAYVFVKKKGKWLNYNVECVRAGMSPYFTKYGYSRRFHDEFVQAEKEAREAKLGIWDTSTQNYGDYDERKAWWDARGAFVKQFEIDAQGRNDYISLTHWDALTNMERYIGKRVTILATVGDVVLGDKGPTRVMLSRRMFGDIPAIFWDSGVFMATGLKEYKREFVRISGTVAEYRFKKSGKRVLQIVVDRSSDVQLSPVPGLEDVRGNRPSQQTIATERPRVEKPKNSGKPAPVPEDMNKRKDEDLPVFGPESEY